MVLLYHIYSFFQEKNVQPIYSYHILIISNILFINQRLTKKIAFRRFFLGNYRKDHAVDGAQGVQWTPDLRGPERSVDLEPRVQGLAALKKAYPSDMPFLVQLMGLEPTPT